MYLKWRRMISRFTITTKCIQATRHDLMYHRHSAVEISVFQYIFDDIKERQITSEAGGGEMQWRWVPVSTFVRTSLSARNVRSHLFSIGETARLQMSVWLMHSRLKHRANLISHFPMTSYIGYSAVVSSLHCVWLRLYTPLKKECHETYIKRDQWKLREMGTSQVHQWSEAEFFTTSGALSLA